MEHLITIYAGLLLEYEPQEVRASMERRGHGKLWHRALKEAERRAGKAAVRTESVITLARAGDYVKHADNIARLNTSPLRVRIDPTIVGGFILRNGFIRIDRSYKTVLINLYNKVIA